MVNVYDNKTQPILDIAKDRYKLDQHDVKIESGSTLPTSKWAELGVYMESYKMGLIDKVEVLKKNPEIFDKEGILRRTDERQQLVSQLQALSRLNLSASSLTLFCILLDSTLLSASDFAAISAKRVFVFSTATLFLSATDSLSAVCKSPCNFFT